MLLKQPLNQKLMVVILKLLKEYSLAYLLLRE